jgi:hypothetical protein
VAAREIRETESAQIYEAFDDGSYRSRDTDPRLEAVVANDCPYLTDVFVSLAYYDASGMQVDTQIETATVAAGTKWSLVHVLKCAERGVGCTPEQWRTRIRITEVSAHRK